LRRRSDGRPNLFSYPDPAVSELVRSAVALAESSDGFALQPTVYMALGAAVNPDQLNADPEVSLRADAPVQLLALDGALERRPLALGQGGASDWMPDTVLHARPLMGWPLEPATRYALVLTSSLRAAAGVPFQAVAELRQGLAGEGPLAAHFAPLSARLSDYGMAAEDLVHATVFTTADPTREMRILSAQQAQMDAPHLKTPWAPPEDGEPRVYESEYPGLLWQVGDKPYSSGGGGFVVEGGVAQLGSAEEPMRLAIAIPQGAPPQGGWPVVIYHHGTGGDFKSFMSGSNSYARDLGRDGLAVVGIDQPLHGTRAVEGTNEEWHTFNPFNLKASAANLRQGALDLLLLHRMIQLGRLDADDPAIVLDPERIFFFGHSQGGLTGALVLPYLNPLPCAVLSGAGAGLTYTLLERKDPLDVAEALRGWGGAEGDLFASHPMLSLVQHAFEPSDPIASAPHWQSGGLHHLLVTSGRGDRQTPAITGDAMAMAGRVPQLEPVAVDLWRHELEGIYPNTGRVKGNATYDEGVVTAGYRQSRQGAHFVIFTSTPMRRMTQRFLNSCAAREVVLQTP
jgi:predicted esterase